MSQQVMIAPGRFVDAATAREMQNLAVSAKCSLSELVSAFDVQASPARALANQLRITESRAESILAAIKAKGGSISTLKSVVAKSGKRP